MKKKSLLLCFLALCLLLPSCAALAKAEPQLKAMLKAVTEDDLASAMALLHPGTNLTEDAFAPIFSNWVEQSGGSPLADFRFNSVQVNTGTGRRSEQAECYITLENGSKFTIYYTYISNSDGDGFTEFRLSDGTTNSFE